jgi:hypothetical protein
MFGLDKLELLFVIWAFLLQIILIIHFFIRRRFFETYTLKYGWLVYAMCFPALLISIILLSGGKPWTLWIGGFLFLIYAIFGYWIDYVKGIQWRKPLRKEIMFPYVTLYLVTIMFYWWPLYPLSLTLWLFYLVLYVIATILNIRSH